MKKLAAFIIILMVFASCEKEPVDLLIGGWKDLRSDLIRGFQEEGQYFWQVDYHTDPNSGTGYYNISEDILRIEVNNYWFDTIYIDYYIFTVGKNALELINTETQDTSKYERVKRYLVF